MPNHARRKKRLATAKDAIIAAILGGQYECESRDDADAIRESIKRHYLTTASPAADALCLWIKDYALTAEESAEGYKGHFALIRVTKRTPKGFTLTAEKHWLPLTRHPGRQRPHYPHPDARHPLLRSIDKGTLYDRMEDALAILSALHAQFPRTTIPGGAKLHIQIYSKPDKNAGEKLPPITKHLLEIITTPEGKFTIRNTAKPQKAPRKKPKRPPASTSETPLPTGFFSARESLKRTRKGK